VVESKLHWHGPYSLADEKQIAAIPRDAFGTLVISAAMVTTNPREDVHHATGNIQTELQYYLRDGKRKLPELKHGILAEFRWTETTRENPGDAIKDY